MTCYRLRHSLWNKLFYVACLAPQQFRCGIKGLEKCEEKVAIFNGKWCCVGAKGGSFMVLFPGTFGAAIQNAREKINNEEFSMRTAQGVKLTR